MEAYQKGIIFALLVGSAAALLIPAAIWAVHRVVVKPGCDTHKRSSVSRMLVFSAYVLLAVWCLRYAVGYYSVITSCCAEGNLTWLEEVFNSMVHTLQTFSMDEDYTTYILDGKRMLVELSGADTWLAGFYGFYASTLNITAIIAGGAILFELLARIFPKVRLCLCYMAFWKEKYYFSELNHASLALAKSICSMKVSPLKRPALIFTDVYTDDESEKSSEILMEAKLLGAVCVSDDLAHVRKNKWGKRTFFLIDEAEGENLQTLVDLSGKRNCEYLKKAEIFLFTNDDAYVQVEKNVRDKLKFREEEMPTFIPVQSYRNLITNLLKDIPLYEPLVGKERDADGNQKLTVTILGKGHIGTEMFLNTYWLGQILNCNLKINVLSQETQEEFWGKIDYLNPEIRATTREGDPILRMNRNGDLSKVYCQVEYLQCDLKSSDFISLLTDEHKNILDTDYFLVSLGSDATNISVANTLRNYVGQHHIHAQKAMRAVIAYVVYDKELADTLNRKKYFSFVAGGVDVYMQAIGSLHDVYSVKNVFLEELKTYAQKSYESYLAAQSREERAKIHKTRMTDDYKYWADLARAMHLNYKVYSMGMIHNSIFDYPDRPKAYKESKEQALLRYRKVVSGEITFESEQQKQEHLELLHKMAWLEHRRWNAFTRIKGFRGTSDYKKYAVPGQKGSYKQMDLKLHPCLVECDQKGIRATVSPLGVVDTDTLFRCEDHSGFDLLDDLSYYLHEKDIIDADFKQYDYPISSI